MDPSKTDKKDVDVEPEEEIKHFKIVLTHRNPKGLESVVAEIAKRTDAFIEKKMNVKVKGPARMPTKRLTITTRKSPCGNGTNTFDRFDMKIHKRVYNIHCSQKNIQQILADWRTEPGMIIEVNNIDDE